MEKRAAELYVDSRDLTFSDLREMIFEALGDSGQSAVNPAMTKGQALRIFTDAIRDRAGDERLSQSQAPMRDRLIATNIVRECLP